MAVRALVTLKLVGNAEAAGDLMERVADYTAEHFGDLVRFQPFIDDANARVVWLNSFADEDTLVMWERAMRESGLRAQVMGPTFEPQRVELLDQISDPRLDDLRANSTRLRSLLDGGSTGCGHTLCGSNALWSYGGPG